MGKDRKTRVLSVIAVFIALISVSISYAAMSTTMRIDGVAKLENGGNWNIYFSNLSNAKITGAATEKVSPIIKNDTYIGNFDVAFKNQNDSIEYDFDIVNDGTIDAELTSLTFIKPTCTSSTNKTSENELLNICSNINYSLITNDGNQILVGNSILSKKSIRVRLIIKYTGTYIPIETITINDLGVVLLYSQK